MKKTYRVAGMNFHMDSWGRTVLQAAPYEVPFNDNVDFEVKSGWEQIKSRYPMFPDEDGEYLSTGSNFYHHLMSHDGMMLHSSAVVVDEKAYLFSADSGTGKSTHTKLWLELFHGQAYILNDDKPAIRREADGWYAYGTPWSGKYDISVNKRVPLAGIAMIERDSDNQIFPFSGTEAIRQIMAQINKVGDMASRIKMLELLDQMLREVPVWKLKCNMDISAARLSYQVMSGKNKEMELC